MTKEEQIEKDFQLLLKNGWSKIPKRKPKPNFLRFAIDIAFIISANSYIDSSLLSTRQYWRAKAGYSEDIQLDPRPIREILETLDNP